MRILKSRYKLKYIFVKHFIFYIYTNISGADIKNVVHGYLYVVFIHFVSSFRHWLLFLVPVY